MAFNDKRLDALETSLQDLPLCMRAFSLSMRSLYAEKAVGGRDKCITQFRELRDDTRNDAMVYLRGVLPICTKFISNLQEYFEYYLALSFDDWSEYLDDIIADTSEHEEVADVLVKLHKGMLVNLKMREDKAKVILAGMTQLTEEYEKKRKELQASAESKSNWALGLAFIPFVNLIASPTLLACADTDLCEAVAKCEQAKLASASALVVKETLIPALGQFIKGLECAAGFFHALRIELTQLRDTGEKAKENPKKLHYKMMQNKAKSIQGGCRSFYVTIPSIETDFEAIPSEGTDKNYVDKWLENQKEIIKSNLEKSIAGKWIKAIKGN